MLAQQILAVLIGFALSFVAVWLIANTGGLSGVGRFRMELRPASEKDMGKYANKMIWYPVMFLVFVQAAINVLRIL